MPSPFTPSTVPGAGALTLIQTITRATDGTIDFTAIPANYSDLLIVGMIRGAAAAATDTLIVRVDGDTFADYDSQTLVGNAAAPASAEAFAATGMMTAQTIVANTAGANIFTLVKIELIGYASTTWNKAAICYIARKSGTATTNLDARYTAGFWRSTTAINQVTLQGTTSANLLTGSSLRLYGIQ